MVLLLSWVQTLVDPDTHPLCNDVNHVLQMSVQLQELRPTPPTVSHSCLLSPGYESPLNPRAEPMICPPPPLHLFMAFQLEESP